MLLMALSAGTMARPSYDPSFSEEAEVIIKDIMNVVGLKPNFSVKAANIPNAAAVAYNGNRYILYNPDFIYKLNVAAGNKWASVSILAHEIGHHLNGHTLLASGSKPPLELEADEFSGFVLRKMGASLLQAQAAMELAASYKPSLTHPGKIERTTAIARGWNHAGNSAPDMAKYDESIRPSRPGNTTRVNSGNSTAQHGTIDKRYILGAVLFRNDRSGNYFVTTRRNFVKVQNGKLYVIGKMEETGIGSYPFKLRSPGGEILYIDRSGNIVTASRHVAGYFKI